MNVIKKEYKIVKDNNDYLGKRFSTYTIEKKITYENGQHETRVRTFIPFRDGDINKINFDKLYFPPNITHEEWKNLSPKYRSAWINGTMNDELAKELQYLKAKEGVI